MIEASGESGPTEPPLLRMTGITKLFPGIQALAGVGLELRAGEVLALVGENGAGKSTLIRILGGALAPDGGHIEINGRPARIASPTDARDAGVAVIHQEFNLVDGLSARANMFLGQEGGWRRMIRSGHERARARDLFGRLGVDVDPDRPCHDLTVAQKQVVEISRALLLEAGIIVMDEPSATLTPREVECLFKVVRGLTAQGMGVIYISHRLEEIFELADRVMILRDGEHVQTMPVGQLTRGQLIELMVGRSLDNEFPARTPSIGDQLLRVDGLNRGRVVRNVSFAVHRGEILGITGLVGAGRSETVRLIVGADRCDSGRIRLRGRELAVRNPRDAISAGICLLSEDRKTQGLILRHSVRENFALPNLSRYTKAGFISNARECDALDGYVAGLRIRLSGREQTAATLSGGNQQKVVLAKWLERHADVIMFDEPTRGIDVGSKHEIYVLMNELAARGKAIIMISSELPEILGMSDRILVMHEGRVTGELNDVSNTTQADIMHLAVR